MRTKPRKNVCRPYLDWLKLQACGVCGKRTGECYAVGRFGSLGFGYVLVDPAHVLKKNHCMGDLWNAVPLARHLHDAQEGHTAAFEARYEISLQAVAIEHTERWLQTADGKAWVAEHPEAAA